MAATHTPSAPIMRLLRYGLAAACLVGVVVWLTDWGALWLTLRATQPIYLIGCVAIYFVGVWLSCLKWKSLLQAQGVSVGLRQLMRWYLIGGFAGTFLPSDVGGDLGRGYLAARAFDDKAAVWSSIVAERITGLAGMIALASLALLLAPQLLGWPVWMPLLLLGGGAAGLAAGLAALRSPRLLAALPAPLRRAAARLRVILERYGGHPQAIAYCLVISISYHALTACSLWLILLALDPQAPPQAALVSPLVGLIGLLPLTPGGLGVREGALAVLLERSGVAAGPAVAAALVSRALLTLTALSGLPALIGEPWPRLVARESQGGQNPP
ncbi:MAG: lysylphosphatidylglycerol synthase transmembrane domain-containing protein [Chloroflexales bacterium]